MKLIILLAVVLMSGCTWKHPTKSEADFHQDLYACERDAAVMGYTMDGLVMKDRCMRSKGWHG